MGHYGPCAWTGNNSSRRDPCAPRAEKAVLGPGLASVLCDSRDLHVCRQQQVQWTVLLRVGSRMNMMPMMQKQTLAQTTSGRESQHSLQVPGPGSCSYLGLFWPD